MFIQQGGPGSRMSLREVPGQDPRQRLEAVQAGRAQFFLRCSFQTLQNQAERHRGST